MKRLLSVLLCISLAAGLLSGCSVITKESDTEESADAKGTTLVIYCWDDEFQNILMTYAQDLIPANVNVQFITTTSSGGKYQDRLDAVLPGQDSLDQGSKVDIFLMEADYAKKYVNSDYTLDVKGDLGLTDADVSDQYEYTKDIATDENGKLKGVSWQAAPGLFVYRRSIAKDVLGTDDPDEVQQSLSDWDKFDAVAAKAKSKGYYMLSGYEDSYRVFSNNVASPWVDENGAITIDPSITQWVEQTKKYTDSGYNDGTTLWDDRWSSDQGPGGKVFGFFCSTWGINFTLLSNSLEIPVADGGKEEKGNGIYGDWAVCEGPEPYFWGGTWIAAAKGTDNKELVAKIMKRLTCDKDTMKKITLDTQDFTNTKTGMQEIADSDYKSDFLGGQNHIALFVDAAEKIDMKNVTRYDQGLNEEFQNAMENYFKGTEDEASAENEFYEAAIKRYPGLKKGN